MKEKSTSQLPRLLRWKSCLFPTCRKASFPPVNEFTEVILLHTHKCVRHKNNSIVTCHFKININEWRPRWYAALGVISPERWGSTMARGACAVHPVSVGMGSPPFARNLGCLSRSRPAVMWLCMFGPTRKIRGVTTRKFWKCICTPMCVLQHLYCEKVFTPVTSSARELGVSPLSNFENLYANLVHFRACWLQEGLYTYFALLPTACFVLGPNLTVHPKPGKQLSHVNQSINDFNDTAAYRPMLD